MKRKPTPDDSLIDAIINELGGKAILDPRAFAHRSIPLANHVRNEVRRRIEWVRSLQTLKLPSEMPSMADIRTAEKALSKVILTKNIQAAYDELKSIWQEPPKRSDALKYHCAAEAYYLMECFSTTTPTGTVGKPFQSIAALIYEAATGEREASTKRACDLVLKNRRRYA